MKQRKIYITLTNTENVKKSIRRIREIKKGIRNDSMYRKISNKAQVKFIRPLLRELQFVPPKRRYPEDYPIKYTTSKQRRYVMWLLNGKPYVPTNKVVGEWTAKIKYEARKNRFAITVKNETEYYGYVVGFYGLGVSRRQIKRYLKPMQGFHIDRGWKPIYKPYQKYINKLIPYVRKELATYFRKI